MEVMMACSAKTPWNPCLSHGNPVTSTSGSMAVCSRFPLSSVAKGIMRVDFDCKKRGGRFPSVRAVSPSTSQSDDYNTMMKRQMKNPYEYHHELGMYYTRITPDLIVGSQPQTSDDIDKLFRDEKVGAILNLQQDEDIKYWGIDLDSILKRCAELGIWHIRRPARDFDGGSLRKVLPRAVSKLEHSIVQGRSVYVHCTAGLGRAPAVAIAYLFWFQDMNLEKAYDTVTSKRPCGPRKEAIRGATYDLVKKDQSKPPFEELPDNAFADVADWERELIQDRVRCLRWN